MTEIPFVTALGDALETSIAGHAPQPIRTRWWNRIRIPPGRRSALVAVLAVLGVGGAAVAATQHDATRLVAGGIACYPGTTLKAQPQTFNLAANGRSPQAVCAHVFRVDGPRALAAPGARLMACADPSGHVAVFEASGSSNQCQSQRMSPLPTAAYGTAGLRMQRLVSRLRAVARGRCIPPQTLVRRVQDVLLQLGWAGWHAAIPARHSHQVLGDGQGGSCGMYQGDGRSISDPIASVDAGRHTVWVVSGPPRPY